MMLITVIVPVHSVWMPEAGGAPWRLVDVHIRRQSSFALQRHGT